MCGSGRGREAFSQMQKENSGIGSQDQILEAIDSTVLQYKIMKDALFLRWHLGLGDSLICHGLVRALREQYRRVFIPCKPHNLPSVRWQFRDDSSVVVISADVAMADHLLKSWTETADNLGLGFYGKDFDPKRWDVSFYEQAGVDYNARWDRFKVDFPGEWPVWGYENMVFRHDDPERNFIIREPTQTGKITILPSKTGTIFSWLPIMRDCVRFECIDSCFAILADQMETSATEFHLYPKPKAIAPHGPPTMLRKPWIIHEAP